jgi:radical SAM superfamily enzyme YgiQ (UPF0313 family)
MDILLAHGYFLSEDPKERRIVRPYPPLGLLYLSSHLKARGFEVGVFDATFRRREEFPELLRRERPRIVGFSCNLMTKRSVLGMMKTARDLGAFVVVGGPDPPYYAEEYLACGADAVVVGEGERTLEEMLLLRKGTGDLGHVRGLVYREEGGRVIRTPPRPLIEDLDAQPFPDRAAVDIGQYLGAWRARHGIGSVSLICARGCPYTCAWCSRSVFGETHRRRSPRNVADEVERIVADHRPDALWYADDVFTIHYRWLFDYVKELKQRGLRVPFECISRADRLNEEVVRALADGGCMRLWIGSESGSQRVLDAMDRRVTVEQVRSMTHLLRRYGIQTGMFIMLGYEGEEMGDLKATVEHLKRVDPDLFLTTLAYPIKGTPYYERVEGRIVARGAWEDRTDRDLEVAGRRSRRYYAFAGRWMTGEVAVHKQLQGPRRNYVRLAKGFVNAKVGRMGMRFTE